MAPEHRSSAEIRATLNKLIAEHDCTGAELSRLIGRNSRYVPRFLKEGRPERLPRDDARLLSRYSGDQ